MLDPNGRKEVLRAVEELRITSEMKAAAPDPQVRLGDEVYMTCLCLENTVLGAIRQVELKKKEGKEIAG